MRKSVRQIERSSQLTGNTAFSIEGIRTAFSIEGIRTAFNIEGIRTAFSIEGIRTAFNVEGICQRIGSGFHMLTHQDQKKAITVP